MQQLQQIAQEVLPQMVEQAVEQAVQPLRQTVQNLQQTVQELQGMLVTSGNALSRLQNHRNTIADPMLPLRKERHPQPAPPGAAAGAAAPLAGAFGAQPPPGVFPPTWRAVHLVGGGLVLPASRTSQRRNSCICRGAF